MSKLSAEQILKQCDAAIAPLSDTQRKSLAEAIEHAQQRQRDQLGETLENSLNFVPALLRGRLRKLLFR